MDGISKGLMGDRADDLPKKLLALNLELAEKEKQGAIVGCWAPLKT